MVDQSAILPVTLSHPFADALALTAATPHTAEKARVHAMSNYTNSSNSTATDELSAHETLSSLTTRLVDALDAGPGMSNSRLIVTFAVASPLLALLCCMLLCLVCRRTPLRATLAAACGRSPLLAPPKKIQPDRASEAHEEELAEINSIDEAVRHTPPATDGEEEEEEEEEEKEEEKEVAIPLDEIVDAPGSPLSKRACCSKMADAIAAAATDGADHGHGSAAPTSAPSTVSRAKRNGHKRKVSVSLKPVVLPWA